MKSRIFRNWITTIFGSLLMFAALILLILDRIQNVKFDFTWYEMLTTAVLGYVFLTAKDSLLEGLFMKLFRIKPKD